MTLAVTPAPAALIDCAMPPSVLLLLVTAMSIAVPLPTFTLNVPTSNAWVPV